MHGAISPARPAPPAATIPPQQAWTGRQACQRKRGGGGGQGMAWAPGPKGLGLSLDSLIPTVTAPIHSLEHHYPSPATWDRTPAPALARASCRSFSRHQRLLLCRQTASSQQPYRRAARVIWVQLGHGSHRASIHTSAAAGRRRYVGAGVTPLAPEAAGWTTGDGARSRLVRRCPTDQLRLLQMHVSYHLQCRRPRLLPSCDRQTDLGRWAPERPCRACCCLRPG